MAGLVPAIHVLLARLQKKTWMPATGARMTMGEGVPSHLVGMFGDASRYRHGRACPGHPRLACQATEEDVDARDRRGHDDGRGRAIPFGWDVWRRLSVSSWPGLSRPSTSCLPGYRRRRGCPRQARA